MGSGWHGGFPSIAASQAEAHTLNDNLADLKKEFTLHANGYFGDIGQTKNTVRNRNISSADPLESAQRFFSLGAEQAVHINELRNADGSHKGYVATMRDRTVMTYRWTSTSDGSPVVEINIKPGGSIKGQKIHFIKQENK